MDEIEKEIISASKSWEEQIEKEVEHIDSKIGKLGEIIEREV